MNPMIAAAAAGLAAAALGVALWALWRGLRGQAATMKLLREGLAAVEAKLAPPPPPAPPKDYTPELDALRDDLTQIATHVGSLSAGQADLRAAVGAAAAASLNDLASQMMERLDESDKRAIGRNETLRDEQQRIIEALEAAQAAMAGATPSAAPPAADAIGPPMDAGDAQTGAATAPDALKALVREAVAEALTEALTERLSGALAPLGETMLSELRSAAETAAQSAALTAAQTVSETIAKTGAAPQRAPSIFNSGKVVSLIATSPAEGA